ncbi:hypothetical protein TUM4261_12370 [Shewanella sp. c952]|nr:hypothetical protein TUM4261_12370 [Shewanella sp. c952]
MLKPNPMANTMAGNPKQIPNRCGKLRLMPKFTPDDINIILFGPGVIPDENANSAMVKMSSIILNLKGPRKRVTENKLKENAF